ncbi:PfaD family polyunsaturated fatty acid/polyketide biosynthesis protein [Nocardia puris]|uniref:PfaD family protein n=1 Tax=Nocardia puris TaxID=208602 RepID=A0A366DCN7_9NOCA|nr:PfaD family polyunsaturated fatty acid/polyketide biosynthesis protein [Nocardia puris]MBF6211179.1 PfaD family polyunsaturated fatty acid/polyketide biosynthesis protein [Nocardia puris]MBF6364898.1 PfaD family polyunsaturated fatty acid/polyketide biosynthesis protein [Nocardia puris]MBF6458684.1 PfaD family polyunsaturated fatty acid/polyketide biosynthesis protein [Nocardia puris]RBO87817.1 PfaD family protein [Nocardia puris]
MTVAQRIGSAPAAPGAGPVVRTDLAGMRAVLARLDSPCHVVSDDGRLGVSTTVPPAPARVLATVPPCPPDRLGASSFRREHGVDLAYLAGAMAHGIASVPLVRAMARAGLLASFGSGGLPLETIDRRVGELRESVPDRPFLVNLLHSPHDSRLEFGTVELLARHGVRAVEASAFLDITPALVWWRLSGLTRHGGRAVTGHRLMAKVSRFEVGSRFLAPAPEPMVADLVARGLLTAEQAELGRTVPMADDITVEADSGGHTDGRSLTALLPQFAQEREAARGRWAPAGAVRLGVAGGLGTPAAVAAAFALGADYVVTGSVNQACVEADVSDTAKAMLVAAGAADTAMAPSADMFEMGSQVQVLRKGTMFAQRAQRLRQLYDRYGGLDELTADDRMWLERRVLRMTLDEAWARVCEYLRRAQPDLAPESLDPRRRMAMVFRWYLGLSSRWAQEGRADRTVDYQLWAGPALGAFNDWAAESVLSDLGRRTVTEVAANLMVGAAYSLRVHQLRVLGVRMPPAVELFRPVPDCAAYARQLLR